MKWALAGVAALALSQFVSRGALTGINVATTITTPTTNSTYDAGIASTVTLSGTARSDRTITGCTWTNSLGGSGSTTGTTSWTISNLALTVGANVVTVTCTNAEGTTAQDVITITRSAVGAITCNVTVANSLTAVNNAIAAAPSSNPSGYYICVQAGSATWGDRIVFPNDKSGLAVVGASVWGSGMTTITEGGATWNCDGCTCPGSDARFGGFTINNTSLEVAFLYCAQNMRFDHNVVTYTTAGEYITSYGYNNPTTSSSDWYTGEVNGVFDHNTFQYVRSVNRGGVSGPNGDSGNDRWAEPINLGSLHALYFEDDSFTYLDASQGSYLNTFDGNEGCSYIVRFSALNNARAEYHSLQGDNGRGCKHWELYNNTWTNVSTPSNAPHSFRQWFIRGGTGVIFHDTSDGNAQNADINMDNDRSHECSISSNQHGCPVVANGQQQVTAWGMCGWDGTDGTLGSEQPDGNSFIDGNVAGGRGYPCRDQIGRSQDVSRWSGSFTNPAPAQNFQPAYIWRNTDPRGEVPVSLNWENSGIPSSHQSTYHLVESRDYYTYRSSFDGSAGVGEGLRASRPATCTTGVGYWSTDGGGNWNTINGTANDGGLDVCTATNTWTNDSYVPYTYPHPRTAR